MADNASITNLTNAVKDLNANVKRLHLVLNAINDNFVTVFRTMSPAYSDPSSTNKDK
jgi:hypothetical protein